MLLEFQLGVKLEVWRVVKIAFGFRRRRSKSASVQHRFHSHLTDGVSSTFNLTNTGRHNNSWNKSNKKKLSSVFAFIAFNICIGIKSGFKRKTKSYIFISRNKLRAKQHALLLIESLKIELNCCISWLNYTSLDNSCTPLISTNRIYSANGAFNLAAIGSMLRD